MARIIFRVETRTLARLSGTDPAEKDPEFSFCNRSQHFQTTGLPIPLLSIDKRKVSRVQHHGATRSPLVSTTKSPARLKAALQSRSYLANQKGTNRSPTRNFVCFGCRQILDMRVSLPARGFLKACSYAPQSRRPFPHSPGAGQR